MFSKRLRSGFRFGFISGYSSGKFSLAMLVAGIILFVWYASPRLDRPGPDSIEESGPAPPLVSE